MSERRSISDVVNGGTKVEERPIEADDRESPVVRRESQFRLGGSGAGADSSTDAGGGPAASLREKSRRNKPKRLTG